MVPIAPQLKHVQGAWILIDPPEAGRGRTEGSKTSSFATARCVTTAIAGRP